MKFSTIQNRVIDFKVNWLDNDRLYNAACDLIVLIGAGLLITIETAWFIARSSFKCGQILRKGYDRLKPVVLSEIQPCIEVVKVVYTWLTASDRLWSAERLPSTIALNQLFIEEVKAEYEATFKNVGETVGLLFLGV
jgi:hypothetical protein